MNESTLIGTLQSHLAGKLDAPVRTSGQEDDRPTPAIVLEDWTTEEITFHNTPFANEAVGDFDGDGTDEYERYLSFDWRTRLEYVIAHTDDVSATALKDDVVATLRPFADDPQAFHADCKRVRVRDHGSPEHQFTEPKETEMSLSLVVFGDHTMVVTPSDLGHDPLRTVQKSFTLSE